MAGEREGERRHGGEGGDRKGEQAAEPGAAEPGRGGQCGREGEYAATRIGHPEDDQQDAERDERADARIRLAGHVGAQAQGERDAEDAEQAERVPVAERRPQAGEDRRLVEVEQAGDVDPGNHLAAERVEGDGNGDGEQAASGELRRRAHAGGGGEGDRPDEGVVDRAVELDPGVGG